MQKMVTSDPERLITSASSSNLVGFYNKSELNSNEQSYHGDKQAPKKPRPNTSDRGLLKRRSRLNKNHLKGQTNALLNEMASSQIAVPPVSSSPSPPSMPPRSKTYCSQVRQSVDSTGACIGLKKKFINDPYSNFDRLQRAKAIAEKAIKNKKVFSIHGPYPLIRKALRDRGWVEKEFKLPLKAKNLGRAGGDSSDADDDDDDDDDDDTNAKDSGFGTSPRPSFQSSDNDENDSTDCYGIMGRMVRNETPTFLWTTRTSSIDWRFLQKDQIVNHFSKANFTTKVGLCMNLRMVSCFSEGDSDTFFPRCYRLSNEEDKLDFIDDFRLTAATGLLKMVISRHVEDRTGNNIEQIRNGQLPPATGPHIIPDDVITFAIKVCRMYGEEREHEDIDKDGSLLHLSDQDWERLISHYAKLVHEGAVMPQSGAYFSRCEEALDIVKDRNPQFFIEGCKNTWIIKPGAKSRGRGIIVMNRLDDILKLVSGDPNLIKDSRWVVQKYIERPLLVYGTKFDVRQWFLVSDWNPITVWIYKESYLRFSSRPFNLENLDPCIHLCNYSVQKNFHNDPAQHPSLPADNMWSDQDFKNYLRSRDCHTLWDDKIFPGMKRAIIHICQTAQDTVEYRKGSFELYGADFMIDENFDPWLIEVNSSPTMSRSTSVTSKLCASVQEDTLKVILDRKKDRNCNIGLFELMYKQPAVDVPLYVGKSLNVEGIPIKKPVVQVRRSMNNSLPFSSLSHIGSRRDCNDVSTTLSKSTQKINTGSNNNTVHKQVRSSVNTFSSSPYTSDKCQQTKIGNTPVKIKMRTTMNRLDAETNNIPNKPNAFNLPKCSNTPQPNSTNPSAGNNTPRVQRSYTKANVNRLAVKFPTGNDNKEKNSSGKIVKLSQAKVLSAVGIINFGAAYSSVVAAANQGCFKNKFAPHPPSQPIVPKNFTISGLAGGEVVAGGNLFTQPPPPPGMVAISPNNVGLNLPFHKYYNADQTHRRGNTYIAQDPRYFPLYSRVSGRHF